MFIWPQHEACWIFVPQPEMEPVHPEVEAWSLKHWATSEVPKGDVLRTQKTHWQVSNPGPEKEQLGIIGTRILKPFSETVISTSFILHSVLFLPAPTACS